MIEGDDKVGVILNHPEFFEIFLIAREVAISGLAENGVVTEGIWIHTGTEILRIADGEDRKLSMDDIHTSIGKTGAKSVGSMYVVDEADGKTSLTLELISAERYRRVQWELRQGRLHDRIILSELEDTSLALELRPVLKALSMTEDTQ